MTQESEIVAQKMKSGTYYKEALEWFHFIYTKPRTELSIMIIICALALTAFGIGLKSVIGIFPISPQVPLVIYRPLTPYETMKILPMAVSSAQKTDQAIISYFLDEYVRSREEYIDSKLARDMSYVANMSDETVATEYFNEVSLDNPTNPKLLYGTRAQVYAEVYSITLLDANNQPLNKKSKALPSKANIDYSTYVIFDDGSQQRTDHTADISFQYTQIIVDQQTNDVTQNPSLVVTSYKTKSM